MPPFSHGKEEGSKEEEDSTQTAKSAAWQLIPFITLGVGEGFLTQLSWHMTHTVRKTAPSSQRLKQLNQYASSPGHSCYAALAVFF